MILCESDYENRCFSESVGLEIYTEGFGQNFKTFITKIITQLKEWVVKIWRGITGFFSNLFNKNKKEQQQIKEFIDENDQKCKQGFNTVSDKDAKECAEKIKQAFEKANMPYMKKKNKEEAKKEVPNEDIIPNEIQTRSNEPESKPLSNIDRINHVIQTLSDKNLIKFADNFDELLTQTNKENDNTMMWYVSSNRYGPINIVRNVINKANNAEADRDRYPDDGGFNVQYWRDKYSREFADNKVYRFFDACLESITYEDNMSEKRETDLNTNTIYQKVYSKFVKSTDNTMVKAIYKSYEDLKRDASNDAYKIYREMHDNNKKHFISVSKDIDILKSDADKLMSLLEKSAKNDDGTIHDDDVKRYNKSVQKGIQHVWNNDYKIRKEFEYRHYLDGRINIKEVQSLASHYYNLAKNYITSTESYYLARDRAIIKAIQERQNQAKNVLILCKAAAGIDENTSIEESSIFSGVKLV